MLVPPFKSSRPIPHISATLHLWVSWPPWLGRGVERKGRWRCEAQGL